MKEKMTLDQAWEECLKMWRWIVEQLDAGRDEGVCALKEEYVRNIGLTPHKPVNQGGGADLDKVLVADCFFCEYNEQHDGNNEDEGEEVWDEEDWEFVQEGHCDQCPGTKVDVRFQCSSSEYSYCSSPRLFLKEIERLNKIRLEA